MKKNNPIVAAAKRGLRETRLVILGRWVDQPPETQEDIVRRLFSDYAVYQIGCLILGALVDGDQQMPKILKGAIKEADRMFGRNLEKNLLRKALLYTLGEWDILLAKYHGNSRLAVEELKKGIEKHCNNGQELAQYRWSRLARALGLPKRSTVRHDRKPVKYGEVGEIIDLAPPLAKKRGRRRSSTKPR
jgi:hypothetical protein